MSLSVPSPKGHTHRRSAAVSLDWSHLVLPSPVPSRSRSTKRVQFSEVTEEIPAAESGDTWLTQEDYSFPTSTATDLAPVSLPIIPNSPVLPRTNSKSKRNSFLPSTKNLHFFGRPSKKRPISPTPTINTIASLPKPLIDLDLAKLPVKPRDPVKSHRRAESAPADFVFSFSPHPSSSISRKRKMSTVPEIPLVTKPLEVVEVRMDISFDGGIGEPGPILHSVPSLPLRYSATNESLGGSSTRKKGWKAIFRKLLH